MRALRVHSFGSPPSAEDLHDPKADVGEVLVRLEASVIGHHDLSVAAGILPLAQPLPYVPGLEGAGRLEDGTLVRVFGKGIGSTRQGTWASLVAAPTAAVVRVPQTLAPDVAAACGSVANTAWAALFDVGRVWEDEVVGVTGATGAVGSLVVQLARDHRVVTWSRHHPENPDEQVDLLIDTVGGPDLPQRLQAVRPGGRAVLVGYTAGDRLELELPALMHMDVSLVPLNMRRHRVRALVTQRLIEDFAAGRLTMRVDMVDLDNVHSGIERLQAGRANGRLVLRW